MADCTNWETLIYSIEIEGVWVCQGGGTVEGWVEMVQNTTRSIMYSSMYLLILPVILVIYRYHRPLILEFMSSICEQLDGFIGPPVTATWCPDQRHKSRHYTNHAYLVS